MKNKLNSTSISFETRVCFPKPHSRTDKFYQACEWYCSLGRRKAHLLNAETGKHSFSVKLENVSLSKKKLFKAVVIRIALGATGIVPMVALLGKMHFRRNNSFEVVSGASSISGSISKKNGSEAVQKEEKKSEEIRKENEIISKFEKDSEGNLIVSNIADLQNLPKGLQISFSAKIIEDIFTVLKDSRVVKLDAMFLNIDAKIMNKLASALKTNQTLNSLDLRYNAIGPKGAKELAEALKENQTLISLDLCSNTIYSEGVKELASVLLKNQTLTSLNLSNNKIGHEGTKELAEALKMNRTLTSLNLNGNAINSEGAKVLASLLKENQMLTSLVLSNNAIGSTTKSEIEEILRSNTTLKIEW